MLKNKEYNNQLQFELTHQLHSSRRNYQYTVHDVSKADYKSLRSTKVTVPLCLYVLIAQFNSVFIFCYKKLAVLMLNYSQAHLSLNEHKCFNTPLTWIGNTFAINDKQRSVQVFTTF